MSIFIEKFNKPSIQVLRVLTKNAYSLEILRKFSRILKQILKKIAKNALFTLAPAGIFRWGSEVHQGRACKGSPRGGFRGAEPPGRQRSFQKICKKINEKLQFLKDFQENFAIFSKILWKFYRIFGENVDKNLEHLEICIWRGFGGRSPPTLANLWKSAYKNQWKPWILLKNFINSESIFYLPRQF